MRNDNHNQTCNKFKYLLTQIHEKYVLKEMTTTNDEYFGFETAWLNWISAQLQNVGQSTLISKMSICKFGMRMTLYWGLNKMMLLTFLA